MAEKIIDDTKDQGVHSELWDIATKLEELGGKVESLVYLMGMALNEIRLPAVSDNTLPVQSLHTIESCLLDQYHVMDALREHTYEASKRARSLPTDSRG